MDFPSLKLFSTFVKIYPDGTCFAPVTTNRAFGISLLLTVLRFPYCAGKALTIHIDEPPFDGIDLTVVKPFKPFTLSCALLVQLNWPKLRLEGQYVLKLFDRRFATQLRQDHRAEHWSSEIEAEYRSFVHNGGVRALFEFCAEKEVDDEWTPSTQKEWTRVQLEAYLQFCCRKSYLTETEVYRRNIDLQGLAIPRLMSRVLIRSPSSSGPTSEYLDCPGILLEYIQGFHLTDLEKFAPKATWQQICDEAIRIINQIGNRGIRNEDVKTRSFVVREIPHPPQFQVFMLDFASCVIRKPDQDDQDWREWKAMQDEEGAIGRVMERKLKGGFQYTRTAESESLIAEFQSEK